MWLRLQNIIRNIILWLYKPATISDFAICYTYKVDQLRLFQNTKRDNETLEAVSLAREVIKHLPLLPEWTVVTSILDTLDEVAGDDAPELEEDDDNTDDILPHLQADDTAVNPLRLLLLLLVTSLVSTSSWLKHPANTRDIRIVLLSWCRSTRMRRVWGKDRPGQ